MSAMAVSLTLESATSVFLAAPVPRPPQPTRPTLIALFWPANRLGAKARPPATADVARKSRRDVLGSGFMRDSSEGEERRGLVGRLLCASGAGMSRAFLPLPCFGGEGRG